MGGALQPGLFALALTAAVALAGCGKPSRPPAQATAPRPAPPAPPPPLTPQDMALALDTLRRAPDHGFPAARFGADEIDQGLHAGAAAIREEAQRRLRAAVLDYARVQHGLTIPQGALPRAWNQRPSHYDAEAELNAALKAGAFKAWLDGLAPQTDAYRALQAAYVAARTQGFERPWPRVEAGSLDLGEQDARTADLRRRLRLEDPGLQDVDPDAPVDQGLIDALATYQTHHGLEATGALDEATAQRLNTPPLTRADRLRVNMERLRWLPRPEPSRRIDVDIASAELTYVRGGQIVTHMLAVAGKLGDETPILSSTIDSIVLDPPWYVPNDIAEREILPKGADYMRARHFVERNGRLIQLPGPKTALGLVKFDFPNPYAVYLHDSPSKASFNLAQRTASHGCVRLQHAVQLAEVIAAEESGLSAARVEEILASGRTVRLRLKDPIPVRLMYLTAEARDQTIVYHPDVYRWDGELLRLLSRYARPRRRP